MVSSLLRGAGDLLSGFGLWRRRPGLMALALAPALVVFVVLVALLAWLGTWLVGLVPGWTGFADGWPEWAAGSLRFAIASAIVLALALVLAVSYTTITLAAGDAVYTRISVATDAEAGPVPQSPAGRAGWVGDTLALLRLGLLWSLIVAVVGLVPGVGGIMAAIGGFIAAGWLQAVGLTAGPLERRGLDRRARARLLRTDRWRVLGFGLVVQALFLVPLGAILAMPAAASGAARLASGLARPVGPGSV